MAVLLAAAPAHAETLREALARAYQSNPQLAGGRAGLRALDEGVEQARALRRPSISASVGINQDFGELGTFDNNGRNFTASVGLDLPLFRGGLIRSSIGAADARLTAGRLDLIALENDLFRQATTAYEDVRRDREVVALNRSNVRVLAEQLRASRDRFEVGDLTRTDVAQSQARLAGAESQLRGAEAQLVASEQAYVRVIGAAPVALEPPPPLGALPDTSARAVELALDGNPTLAAQKADAEASGFDIGVARAAGRPTLTGSTGARYQNYLGTLRDSLGLPDTVGVSNDTSAQSVGITLSVPIYQGGAVASRVRQARARQSQSAIGIITVERQVTEQARNAFEALVAARAVIVSAESAVAANELALEGTRAENSAGLRTILEVLNAEQELLNTRVELVRARRDAYVAGIALLAALGRATAADLALPVAAPPASG